MALPPKKYVKPVSLYSGNINPTITAIAGNRNDIYFYTENNKFYIKTDVGLTKSWAAISTPNVVDNTTTGDPGPRGQQGMQGLQGDSGDHGLETVTMIGPITYDTQTNTLEIHQLEITDGGNF